MTMKAAVDEPDAHAPVGLANGISERCQRGTGADQGEDVGVVLLSAEMTEARICVSLVAGGNSGRNGRSIRRLVSVSFSVGRPSRLMKPPGMRPAA